MPSSEEFDFVTLRAEMVDAIAVQVRLVAAMIGRDQFDDRVMATMACVPRHDFVPMELRGLAYLNVPLPIGFGKTTSQPFIVALMTELLEINGMDVVLEIGTGLGYQAAILSEMANRVYTIEIVEELAQEARRRLDDSGTGTLISGSATVPADGRIMRRMTKSLSRRHRRRFLRCWLAS
jgi:Protein-L-isoaspartate carboxylmethyltransferase